MGYLFNFRFLKNVRLQNIFCTHLEEHDLNLIGTDKGLTNTIFFSECSSGLKILFP